MAQCTRVLWALNANWNDDGWSVEANSPDNPNSWNAGNEFLSRNPFLSPPALFLSGRGFRNQPLAPATNHAAHFFDAHANFLKLFVRYQLCFPRDLYEEAQRISDANGPR